MSGSSVQPSASRCALPPRPRSPSAPPSIRCLLPSRVCFPKSFCQPSASWVLICGICSPLWCNSSQVKRINKQILPSSWKEVFSELLPAAAAGTRRRSGSVCSDHKGGTKQFEMFAEARSCLLFIKKMSVRGKHSVQPLSDYGHMPKV